MKKNLPKIRQSKRKLKTKKILLWAIPGAILLVVLIAVGSYVSSLINLVKEPDFTGDPTLQESDIFQDDDYVTPTAGAADPSQTGRTFTRPGETTTATTTVETTIDPLVILTEEYDAVLAGLPLMSNSQVYNLLVIGTDNRGNELNGRSDTMIIVSVNKRNNTIQIVSLMRALYVQIPGREHSMLNAAFSWGGPRLLIKTIEANFRVAIDDYVVINFTGFERIIDKVGGITVSLTDREAAYLNEKTNGTGLAAGSNQLNGHLALWYARTRKIDSDFTRTSRQRTVIEALIQKAGQMSLGELDGLAREILPFIKSSRTGTAMLTLVADAYAWRNYPISQLMLPISKSFDPIVVRGAQMYWFDAQANVEKLQQFLYH